MLNFFVYALFFRGALLNDPQGPTLFNKGQGPKFALEPKNLSKTMVQVSKLLTKPTKPLDRLSESQWKTKLAEWGLPDNYKFSVSDFYIKKVEIPVIDTRNKDEECVYVYQVMAGKNVLDYCDDLDVAKNVALANVAKQTLNIYVLAVAIPVP